jgi:hypothetical protein
MAELSDVIEAGALNLGAKELTKRRRMDRVLQRAEYEMKSCGFWLARNEQSMCFSRGPAFEHDDTVVGLVNLLNSPTDKGRGDLEKHMLDFGGAQCHVAAALQAGK